MDAPNTALLPEDDATDAEKQQALVAALRRQRGLGLLGQLTGDAVLSPTGASLVQNVQHQQQMLQGAQDRALQRQLLAQRYGGLSDFHQGELDARNRRLEDQEKGIGAFAKRPQMVNLGDQVVAVSPDTSQDAAPGAITTHMVGKVAPKSARGILGGRGGGAGGGGGLTPAALDAFATAFHQTGQLPSGLGMGAQGAALKVAIANRRAELFPDDNLAGNHASYGADAKSLQQLQRQVDSVEAFEKTAGKNLDTFLVEARKVADVGSPLLNRPLRALDTELAGKPNMGAFNAARQTAVTEIGKVLSGATGGGTLSDSARHEVEGLMGPNATLAQLLEAARVLRQDMANRRAAYRGQLEEIRGRASGKKQEAQASTATPTDTAPSSSLPPDAPPGAKWLRSTKDGGKTRVLGMPDGNGGWTPVPGAKSEPNPNYRPPAVASNG